MHLNELNRLLAVGAVRSSASRMPSRAIWQTCPWAELSNGTKDGFTKWTDFLGNHALANNTTVTATDEGFLACTAATAGTAITMPADAPYGVVKLESTTDNEDAIISALGGSHTGGQIVFEADKRLWFEARIKQVNITDSKFNVFCGFAEEGLVATTTLITASDAMADKDFVGFQRVFADGDKLDVVYNTAGGGGATTHDADAITIVADTYKKVGIYCDGTNVHFFDDGAKVGDPVALTATNFPNGEELAFYLGIMLGHGDTGSVSIDWLKIAQERAA